eukprot:9488797-Pyramimonas_sp.AAC.1
MHSSSFVHRRDGLVIVTSAYGSAGDILPMMGFAKAIQDRGEHQVLGNVQLVVIVTHVTCAVVVYHTACTSVSSSFLSLS